MEEMIKRIMVYLGAETFSTKHLSSKYRELKAASEYLLNLANSYTVFDEDVKPQEAFKETIDNSYNPFVPKIVQKYYTDYPIPDQILKIQTEYLANPNKYHEVVAEDGKKMNGYYPHPYMQEIKELPIIPNTNIEPYNPNKEVSMFIEKEEELKELTTTLETITEFGIDLQYNTSHSYLGITCLMSIVTRTDIYFIDTLKLWKDMHLLHPVFANPKILKIFLGSELDIKNLQRDFGIYVINMFDIVKAGIILGHLFSGNPLPYFLNTLCNIKLTSMKYYPDWRTRPLLSELIGYAKKGVQYLLYMYDMLRGQLIEKGDAKDPLMYLSLALKRSKEISIVVYRKPDLKDANYYKLCFNNRFKDVNRSIFKSLYKYRDYVARVEDEGAEHICNSELLTTIAETVPVNVLITT
jgi:exosome complex exonuclease RRP6